MRRRNPHDGYLIDAKAIEEFCIGVGLHGRGRGGWHIRAKIAKTGRCYETVSEAGQRACHIEGLVETAACTMDDEYLARLRHSGRIP